MENKRIIGTLSEKSTHAFLKKFICDDELYHEVSIDGFVCDILKDNEIYEIQTKCFKRLIPKLDKLLDKYEFTIVFPLYNSKSISWIDKDTGEVTNKKSSIRAYKYQVFEELYGIREYLNNPHLHIKIIMLDGVEYKYADGYGKYKKIKATKIDKIPSRVVDIFSYNNKYDYFEFLPFNDNEEFTLKELATKLKMDNNTCNMMLKIFTHNLHIVKRCGKRGKAYLYKIYNNDNIEYNIDDECVIY